MKIGHERHYDSIEEALIDMYQRVDKRYPAEIQGNIGRLIKGVGSSELIRLARRFTVEGLRLIGTGNLAHGEALVSLGNLISPVNPLTAGDSVGG